MDAKEAIGVLLDASVTANIFDPGDDETRERNSAKRRSALAVLSALAEENAALKAEAEDAKVVMKAMTLEIGNLKAEVGYKRGEIESLVGMLRRETERADYAEAELAAWKHPQTVPLVNREAKEKP